MAAGDIETFRVGIANNVQKAGRPQTSHFGIPVDDFARV
jgi:hypothetical protein